MSDSCIVPPPITDPKELDEREPDPSGLELTEMPTPDSADVRIEEMRPISDRAIRSRPSMSWLALYLVLPLAVGMIIGSIFVLLALRVWQEPDQPDSLDQEGVTGT